MIADKISVLNQRKERNRPSLAPFFFNKGGNEGELLRRDGAFSKLGRALSTRRAHPRRMMKASLSVGNGAWIHFILKVTTTQKSIVYK